MAASGFFRKLHRKTALIIFLPLLISALTGIIYRLGKTWFGMSNQLGNLLMVIHQGEYLGTPLVPIYVLLVGLGLLGMIITGLSMTGILSQNRAAQPRKLNARKVHRIFAPIVFLPLTVSAVTGVIYRLGKSWFGMSSGNAAIFLRIHQGSYLGDFFKPIYVLLVGLGLIVMLITGINQTGIFRQRRQPPQDLGN
ncbi:MAG: PepSY domain-containing protein [Richelia sp. SM1_7_0]|nr:PepSY domain-containing protein [Richelia sp. SM1_7_0]